jgi:hypothetical protein
MDLAVHAELAHAARDELRVLGTEIQDQDAVGVDVGVRTGNGHLCRSLSPVPCPILASWADAGGEALEILYSLYDALISINVPADKAGPSSMRWSVTCLSKLATKTDLQLLRAEFERDMARQTVTLLLGSGSITVACAGILFALLKLT